MRRDVAGRGSALAAWVMVVIAVGAVVVGAVGIGLASAGSAKPPAARSGSKTAAVAAQSQAANATAAAARRSRPARAPRPSTHLAKATTAHHPAHTPAWACAHQPAPPPVPAHPISHPQWLSRVTITEYYPANERWFMGRRVQAPGLAGAYPVDLLYGAHGLAMQGEGVDLQGRPLHIARLGSTGWVNAAGRPTFPVCLGKWTNGFPSWLSGGWRNVHGAVTYPLASGGWTNGRGVRMLDYGGVTFAAGQSQQLRYYHSIAVDPRLIPLGSRVYVPAYRHLGGGWFVAQDTGGAIKGHHIDVYRSPPASVTDLGRYLTGQRIYVIPPQTPSST